METIQVHGKTFQRAIPYEQLQQAIAAVATRINTDYAEKETPLFLGVLNGSFMFMGELMKHIEFNCEISFVKLCSYNGTQTSGTVQQVIGLGDSIKGRHVIIVEDIVDTGTCIDYMTHLLQEQEPASISVATLLFKPEAYTKHIPINYYAMAIPNKFIVGFGLDYNQQGRNYKDIYEIVTEHE